MSWDFYKNKTVKASKDYTCDWKDHLEMCEIFSYDPTNKSWYVNVEVCKEFGITNEEITTLQNYLSDGCVIHKGELHNTTFGKIEGMFATFRCKISISDIVHKYELVTED